MFLSPETFNPDALWATRCRMSHLISLSSRSEYCKCGRHEFSSRRVGKKEDVKTHFSADPEDEPHAGWTHRCVPQPVVDASQGNFLNQMDSGPHGTSWKEQRAEKRRGGGLETKVDVLHLLPRLGFRRGFVGVTEHTSTLTWLTRQTPRVPLLVWAAVEKRNESADSQCFSRWGRGTLKTRSFVPTSTFLHFLFFCRLKDISELP